MECGKYGKYILRKYPYHTLYFILQNIRIYGISRAFRSPKDFYENISVSTGGKHVSYDEIRSMFGILKEMPQHDNAMLQVNISLILLLNHRDRTVVAVIIW
jgi:hypothetical protein